MSNPFETDGSLANEKWKPFDALMLENDILLIAGKGHEDYQIIGREKFKFSDIEIAKEAIQKGIKVEF